MKKDLSSMILVLVFFMGLSVLLYPAVSDYINSKTQSRAVANYDSIMSEMKEEDCEALLAEAEAYNAKLYELNRSSFKPTQIDGYSDILNIGGTGIMGYVSIDKIKVELPIYHGTDEGVLQVAAGHLEGSSLPIGGRSTHCAISAHRGAPKCEAVYESGSTARGR